MNQQDLERYLWGAATALRGTIDAGDYKQFIFPLLFFKRICDVYEEEFQKALEESDGDKDYAAFVRRQRKHQRMVADPVSGTLRLSFTGFTQHIGRFFGKEISAPLIILR